MKCVFCGQEFDKLSEEHIIPNCICGRLKSKKLLCKDCNSGLGDSIDLAFDGVYNDIINKFAIKRERGESNPSIAVEEKTGKVYQYLHDGSYEFAKPHIEVEDKDENTFLLKIEANPNSKKDVKIAVARQIYESREELKKKGIDYKSKIKEIQKKIDENWDKIAKNKVEDKPALLKSELALGGKGVALAVLKMAFLFFKDVKPDIAIDDEDIISILREQSDDVWNRCIFYSNEKDIFEIVPDDISHYIFVRGSEKYKKIVVYIQLFSLSIYVCILSNDYEGKDFNFGYGFNLLGQSQFTPVCYEIENLDNLLTEYDYKHHPEQQQKLTNKYLDRIFKLYYKLNPSKKWDEIQLKVRREIENIAGEEFANSPRIQSCIEILGQVGHSHFTEEATQEQQDEIIRNLAYIILEQIINDFWANQ